MLKDSNPKQVWVPGPVVDTLREVRQPGEKLYETVQRLADAAKQVGVGMEQAARAFGTLGAAVPRRKGGVGK